MMLLMKRTTLFLPDELHESLRREAFSARVSMAELIRRRLERRGSARRAVVPSDPLAGVEGIVSDGRLSQDLDEALYSR
jgi:hypothetical protein